MEHIDSFDQLSVVVIGDVMLDSYWYGNTHRISPEAPVPVVQVGHIDRRPGGAANVALNMKSLGANVTLQGICGDDEDGMMLGTSLKVAGIENRLCQQTQLPTINKLRILSQSQQLMRLDFEQSYEHVDKTELHQSFMDVLSGAQMVVISDYAKGTLTDIPFLIEHCKQHHVPVIIDPKGKDYAKYRGATMITPNRKEFELVAGLAKNNEEFLKLGQQMLKEYQLESLLVTRGAEGMTLFRYSEPPFHLHAQAKAVFDVTGAGDTVIGVVSTCLASGMSFELSLKLANYAASLVVGQVGAATVSINDLKQFEAEQLPELSFEELQRKLNQHQYLSEKAIVMAYSELENDITAMHQLITAKRNGQYIYITIDANLPFEQKQQAIKFVDAFNVVDGVACLTSVEIQQVNNFSTI